MIEWAIVIVGAIHCGVFLNLIYRFSLLPSPIQSKNGLTFSIIIPVRNEVNNLSRLLESIHQQDYPDEKFEIIVVDDSSEDGTLEQVKSESHSGLKFLSLSGGKKGKKAAIELGVANATKEIILTTDGDCRVPQTWLSSFNQAFDERTKMVVGPVKMTYSNFLGALQSFDFSILIGYAASLVGMGIPSMSNGANLAYRREVFGEVGGYSGNDQIPSGDDEFLLLKVVKKHPSGIRFLKDSGAVVSTEPKPGFMELLNQRIRWLSKWTLHKNPKIIVSVIAILIDNLAMILCILGLIFGFLPAWVGLVLVGRFLIKGLFSMQTNKLLQGKTNWLAVIVYEFIYPFYVVLLSLASIFGYYTWKGRKYT